MKNPELKDIVQEVCELRNHYTAKGATDSTRLAADFATLCDIVGRLAEIIDEQIATE